MTHPSATTWTAPSPSPSPTPITFITLPEDVLITITCHLTPLDAIALSKTCTAFYRVVYQRVVWVRLYARFVTGWGLDSEDLIRSGNDDDDSERDEHGEEGKERRRLDELVRETIASYTLAMKWKTTNESYRRLKVRSRGSGLDEQSTRSSAQKWSQISNYLTLDPPSFSYPSSSPPYHSPLSSISPHSYSQPFSPSSVSPPLPSLSSSPPHLSPLLTTHIIPPAQTTSSNPTFLKFVDIGVRGWGGRLVVTVSRVVWLVVEVWDVGRGVRRDGSEKMKARNDKSEKGKAKAKDGSMGTNVWKEEEQSGDDDDEAAYGPTRTVEKTCLCQWSARGASFSGIVVNEESDGDGSVAVGLLKDGRHCIQILKLTPPSSSSSSWTLAPTFTLDDIPMDMYPVSFSGSYLSISNAGMITHVIDWKRRLRGILDDRNAGGDGGGGAGGGVNGLGALGGGVAGLQYNKCSQVLVLEDTKSVLVIRARSIHLFRWPRFYVIRSGWEGGVVEGQESTVAASTRVGMVEVSHRTGQGMMAAGASNRDETAFQSTQPPLEASLPGAYPVTSNFSTSVDSSLESTTQHPSSSQRSASQALSQASSSQTPPSSSSHPTSSSLTRLMSSQSASSQPPSSSSSQPSPPSFSHLPLSYAITDNASPHVSSSFIARSVSSAVGGGAGYLSRDAGLREGEGGRGEEGVDEERRNGEGVGEERRDGERMGLGAWEVEREEEKVEMRVASYSFGWVDCVTATVGRGKKKACSEEKNGRSKVAPIYIFFRGALDDPWANDDTKLEMWVVEGNEGWGGDDESERHEVNDGTVPLMSSTTSPLVATTPTSALTSTSTSASTYTAVSASLPYIFPPTPISNHTIMTRRGPLL
ncbi:hypothetical protein CVT24_004654, partial [Panaeolus cyanescens]